MPLPPYTTDLTLCDFFLFSKPKKPIRGRRFSTIDEVKRIIEGADGHTEKRVSKNVGTHVLYKRGIILKETK